jgi:hypothetical protein
MIWRQAYRQRFERCEIQKQDGDAFRRRALIKCALGHQNICDDLQRAFDLGCVEAEEELWEYCQIRVGSGN